MANASCAEANKASVQQSPGLLYTKVGWGGNAAWRSPRVFLEIKLVLGVIEHRILEEDVVGKAMTP